MATSAWTDLVQQVSALSTGAPSDAATAAGTRASIRNLRHRDEQLSAKLSQRREVLRSEQSELDRSVARTDGSLRVQGPELKRLRGQLMEVQTGRELLKQQISAARAEQEISDIALAQQTVSLRQREQEAESASAALDGCRRELQEWQAKESSVAERVEEVESSSAALRAALLEQRTEAGSVHDLCRTIRERQVGQSIEPKRAAELRVAESQLAAARSQKEELLRALEDGKFRLEEEVATQRILDKGSPSGQASIAVLRSELSAARATQSELQIAADDRTARIAVARRESALATSVSQLLAEDRSQVGSREFQPLREQEAELAASSTTLRHRQSELEATIAERGARVASEETRFAELEQRLSEAENEADGRTTTVVELRLQLERAKEDGRHLQECLHAEGKASTGNAGEARKVRGGVGDGRTAETLSSASLSVDSLRRPLAADVNDSSVALLARLSPSASPVAVTPLACPTGGDSSVALLSRLSPPASPGASSLIPCTSPAVSPRIPGTSPAASPRSSVSSRMDLLESTISGLVAGTDALERRHLERRQASPLRNSDLLPRRAV